MALKFKAKLNSRAIDAVNKKLAKLGQPLTRGEFKTIGRRTVREMKKLILRGLSPIRGGGFKKRFPRYKRQNDPKGYPATVKSKFRRKKQRPVNLKLSGKFLNSLTFKASSRGVEVGYFKKKSQKKEQGHREGTNTQPKRPTIPASSNKETFVTTIQNEYLRIANAKIRQITKKKN